MTQFKLQCECWFELSSQGLHHLPGTLSFEGKVLVCAMPGSWI